jgi:7,8-dihydropterin-6-yl-methyl-4-(beta-D-ribofuranosyl)aminobenzene 5'-phosphate synthase
MTQPSPLRPVSKVEITVLIDNYFDALLPPQPGITRPLLAKEGKVPNKTLIAEHGLSILVDVFNEEGSFRVLLDTGYNSGTILHNMEMLGVEPATIQALVISHGHMDHTGSVHALLEKIGSRIPIYFHPGIFTERYIERPFMGMAMFPQPLNRRALETGPAETHPSEGPITLADDMIMATGAIPRVTPFEKGMPGAKRMMDGRLEADTMEDDQSIVINVRDLGLVVISGCAHAGIVNSVKYAMELTGEGRVCAIIGGFHLAGPDMGPVVDATMKEIKKLSPKVIMPMHCTGFEVINGFGREFPHSFALSAVGAKLTLPYDQ